MEEETNGDAETQEQEATEEREEVGEEEQDEAETEAVEVKSEPQEVEMKDYAEDTMNELLGIYGYDGVDKSVTENLQLQHFSPEDREARSGKEVEGTPDVSNKSVESSPNKSTDKLSTGARRRSSSSSGYHLRELKTSPVSVTKSPGSAALVNGGDKSLMNQYKASKSPHKKKQRPSTSIASSPVAVVQKRKRHDSSSSDDSMCSCGTCDLDHDSGIHPLVHAGHQVDIIREIQKILDENKALRKENKKLKAELTDTFRSTDVKQLSQDIRQLTSQLQGNIGGLQPSRPPSAGSTTSSTPLKINGSARKLRIKQQKPEELGEHDGYDEEEMDQNTEELWIDSGILMPSSRIQTALQSAQQNYRLFTRSLMEMVFTKETMAASSARGQKAMGKNSMENANPRPPLDQDAVQAIVSRVCSEFPDVHQTLVMGVIRQKIADVRKRLKIQSTRESNQHESV